MIISKDDLFKEAINLSPMERAQLVELILSSFNFKGRKEIDSEWAIEAEDRLQAAQAGYLEKISAEDVFSSLNI